MAKILLFVCLALLGASVYGQTQIRFVNVWYLSELFAPGMVASLTDPLNITISSGTQAQNDGPNPQNLNLLIPASPYQLLPANAFVAGQPLRISVVNSAELTTPYTELAFLDNFTITEGQSYSFVYVDSSDFEDGTAFVTIPPTLMAFDELPSNPTYGKALVRIVNVAVSTFSPASNMNVTLNGTGVAAQQVSLPFGEASDFLEYNSAVQLTLYTTLPIDGATLDRTLTFTTAIDKVTVIYIRGDLGAMRQNGMSSTTVDFPPAPPMDTPVAPPMAAAPMADTPVAVPVASGPVAAPVRAPVKRTSSAAQTVAQIAGVAGLMSLLF
jgi:hypothetical protein